MKHYSAIFLLTLIIASSLTNLAVAQEPEDWNFRFEVVDDQGVARSQVLTVMYEKGNPDRKHCRGYCAGYKQKLPPGEYELVVEQGLIVHNIKIEEGKQVDKVIRYAPPPITDWNFSLTLRDENGQSTSAWYEIYDARDRNKIYCFCSNVDVPRLLLPPGEYAMKVGFLETTTVSGIVIKDGKKTEKVVTLAEEKAPSSAPTPAPAPPEQAPTPPVSKSLTQKESSEDTPGPIVAHPAPDRTPTALIFSALAFAFIPTLLPLLLAAFLIWLVVKQVKRQSQSGPRVQQGQAGVRWFGPLKIQRRNPLVTFLSLAVFGAILIVSAGADVFYNYVTRRIWNEVPAVVTTSKVDSYSRKGRQRYYAVINYTYRVDAQSYRGTYSSRKAGAEFRQQTAQEKLTQYPVGSTLAIRVNPKNPRRSVLPEQITGSTYFSAGLGIFLVLLGLLSLKKKKTPLKEAAPPSSHLPQTPPGTIPPPILK